MFHRKKTSIIGTGTAFDNSLFWLTIIILVFSTGGLTWQYIPTFNLETHVTEYDKIIIESFSIIYYSIISLISLRILVKIIKKKEVSWTTSHSNKALSLFFLFILLNIIWNININLFQWMTNYVNTDFELGRIYNLTALLLHIAISYTLLSFFSLFLIALATSIYKIQSFLNTKQHSKTNVPVHSSDECSSLANLKFRLESQVSIQHLKQLFIIVAICSSLLIGVWFFSNFAGNSVMSEINAAARSVNTERIAKVIEQDGLDTKIASIKTKIMKARLANLNPHKIETLERKKITTSSEQTITVWQPKSNQSINQNTASEIINELEKIDTLSISGEKINYPLLLKKIATEVNALNERLKEYQPIDWESVAIRIAFLSLLIFIIQLLFAAYKQTSKELIRLQDQLTTVEIILANNTNNIDSIGDLFAKLTNSIQIERTPESLYEKGFNNMSRTVGGKGMDKANWTPTQN